MTRERCQTIFTNYKKRCDFCKKYVDRGYTSLLGFKCSACNKRLKELNAEYLKEAKT